MSGTCVVDYVRSPSTQATKGALAGVRQDDLAASVIRRLTCRDIFDVNEIEDVLSGCAFTESEQGLNIGRTAGLLAGLPQTVGGATVNRWGGRSKNAIHMAVGSICMGSGEVFVAGAGWKACRVY